MGISTWVQAFKPADEKWQKMKATWDLCKELGMNPPRECYVFFEGGAPSESGVEVNIKSILKERYDEQSCYQIIELNIDDLPKDIKILQFVMG
ncbi:MAG: hypothetical protein V4485_06445 [Pseudomonadota bacterium]